MCNNYNSRQICLLNQLRLLWSQHVYWTRFFILSVAEGLADLEPVTARLLENPAGFSKVFARFFGARRAAQFEELLRQHLIIGGDLVKAAKAADAASAEALRRQWYQNADEIAAFLAEINACWRESEWRAMLYSHLEMTQQEAALRIQGNDPADIRIFGKIEAEAMEMADMMFCGLAGFCV